MVGRTVSHYRIEEKLGGGAMGVVYRGVDLTLERPVALKFLPPEFAHDEAVKERFIREARAASRLDHPHIATIHEIGQTEEDRLFIVMPFYEGETLKQKITRGPLPIEEVIDYTLQIAEGLQAAHQAAIIHRDIKPANVMVTKDGQVKIVDFGLAKVAGTELTKTGQMLGTVAYMSPEQARGEGVDHRTDLWSLGVVCYEMLTGQRPFTGSYEQALLYEILNEDPEPVSALRQQIPGEVEEMVMRCLQKGPSHRYVSAQELLSALREAGETLESTSREHASKTSSPRSILGMRSKSLLATVGLVVSVAVTGVFFWGLLLGTFDVIPWQPLPADPAPRLAVLASFSQETGSKERQLMEDLGVTLTGLLTEMKPYLQEGTEIIAATEMGAVSTVEQARNRLGVSRVITLHLAEEVSAPRLTLGLVDADKLEQVRSAPVSLNPTERDVQTAGLAPRLAELLDIELPLSFLQQLRTPEDVDPAARAYFEEGRDALQRRDSEEIETAIRFFNLALQNDSTFPEAYAGLAQAHWHSYQQTGDSSTLRSAQRFEILAQAFEDNPRPGVYVQRGLLSALRGDYQNALVDFTFAVNLDSTHVEAHRGLAQTLAELGHLERAEKTFQETIRLQPDDWRGYNALGRFYFNYTNREEPYRKAAEQFRNVIVRDSLNGTGYVNLGSALFGQQKLEEAQQIYEYALKLPGLSSVERNVALSNLGTIHYYAGRYEEAARTFESALEIDSTDQRVWGNLVSSYDRLGREEHARWAARHAAQRTERALEVRPDDSKLLTDLAEYALILGDRERVRRLIDRSLAQKPKEAGVIFQIGHLYEKLGERNRAINLILRSVMEGYSLTKIEDDPELADLRSDSRFQQAVTEFTRSNHNKIPIEP